MKILLAAPNDGHSELYLRRAFEQLGHSVTRFDYRTPNVINPNDALLGFDLEGAYDLILILKGERFNPDWLKQIHPCVLWDFDLWNAHEPWRQALASSVDYFLTPSDGYFDKEFGIKSHYMPEAADPTLHRVMFMTDEEDPTKKKRPFYASDVNFTGTVAGVPGRDEWLAKVGKWCDDNGKTLKIWGSFPGALSKKWHTGHRAAAPDGRYEDENYNLVVNNSKVVLDRQRNPEIRGCVSARVFRTMAAKGLVLARQMTAQEELLGLVGGKNCYVYEGDGDCLGGIRMILDEPDYSAKVAQNGYDLVMARHLWIHRAAAIIKLVGL